MVDSHQLAQWLAVTILVIALPLLPTRRLLSHPVVAQRLSRFGGWALDKLRPTPEFDEVAYDLIRAQRREQLSRDVQRLRRIVATDMSMSATRQLGNRLAYERLLRDLRDGPEPRYAQLRPPMNVLRSSTPPGGGRNVEILEIGWRR